MQALKPQHLLRASRITQLEAAARAQGFKVIAGVDEAGRGPLAGPVVAAACILPPDFYVEKIDDSKKLSHEVREELFEVLTTHPAVIYGIGMMDAFMIDQINILQATLQAMAAAIGLLSQKPDLVLVDGNKKPPVSIPCQTIIKGDSLSQSIMAASVIAKVTRDRLMLKYDSEFPNYGFSKHKGYPTKAHLEALKKWGASCIHRQTFRGVV